MIRHKYLWTLNRREGLPAKVQFRVKWNSSHNIATFSLGFCVDEAKWSQEAQRCKANTTHTKDSIPANIINKRIDEYETLANQTFAYFENQGSLPNVDAFKQKFNELRGIAKKREYNDDDSVYRAFNEFLEIAHSENNWTIGTYKSTRSAMMCLYRYNPKLSMSLLDRDELARFTVYMENAGLKNSYIKKTIRCVKQFLFWSQKRGSYKLDGGEFSVRLTGIGNTRQKIFLTWGELIHLYNMEFERRNLQEVKDVFCFSCFSSLRYSDVSNLKRCDVTDKAITLVTKKTSEGLSIELNNYSKAILDRYKDYRSEKGDYALPHYDNSTMNKYLKRICKQAGFTYDMHLVYFSGSKRYDVIIPKYRLISTHCGRHTFIVNALYLGIPSEVVMKWTGHADYECMRPYIEIVDSLKTREMNKFNIGVDGISGNEKGNDFCKLP